MRTLAIDIETYASVSLKDAGVYAYTQAPDFTILLFGYAWGGGPVQVVDLTESVQGQQSLLSEAPTNTLQEIPPEVKAALTDPDVLKTAFNANFERVCLAAYFGREMDPAQWECTMIRAAEAGLPRTLKAAGRALGLSEDKKKDAEGQQLIRYFCMPCRPTRTNGYRTRNLPQHDKNRWRKFVEYNRQDVIAERAVRNALPDIPEPEQQLWEIDQRINDRGVMIDRQLVDEMVTLDIDMRAQLLQEAKDLTRVDNPNSRNQMLRWINKKSGMNFETFRKEDLPTILQATDDPGIHRALEIRQSLSKTSTQKYRAMQNAVCPDGRVRGLTAFYGAPRTGRWSGRLVQLQNLPRNYLADLDGPRDLVREGHGEMLPLLYENAADVMSQLIRTALVPKDGCRFIVSDFSAIEARVLAWLAKEDWRLRVFEGGGKIYEESASKMFGVPIEKIVKGNPEYALRQKGKIAELALGYQGAAGALIAMGALKMGLEEEDLPDLVAQWRASNPHIIAFWEAAESTARKVLTLPAGSPLYTSIRATGGAEVRFYHNASGLRIQLPSGRSLYYRNARIESRETFGWGTDGIVYNGTGEEAAATATYGGKLTENIVQAIARDCLAEAMRRLDALGFQIVFHVHDEVIIEAPNGKSSAAEVAALMGQPIDWAPGLPLNADAYECSYYKKD